MVKKKTTEDTPDFEVALKELEAIVERMEQGEQTLENSLKDFERGMELSKQCQENLKKAELRVEKMLHNNASQQNQAKNNEDE